MKAAVFGLLPFLGNLWDKISNKDLITYLKDQIAQKDKQIERLTSQLTKKFKSKGKENES